MMVLVPKTSGVRRAAVVAWTSSAASVAHMHARPRAGRAKKATKGSATSTVPAATCARMIARAPRVAWNFGCGATE